MKRRSYELIFKKFNSKLDKLLNKHECCLCSKLLYNTQICNIKFNNSIGEHLKLLYSYNNLNKNKEQVSQLLYNLHYLYKTQQNFVCIQRFWRYTGGNKRCYASK